VHSYLTSKDPILHMGECSPRHELVEAFRKRGSAARGAWRYPGLVTPAQQRDWQRVCFSLCILVQTSSFKRYQRSQGYDAYDLVKSPPPSLDPAFLRFSSQWDLGEFHQKGTTSTRWGSKDELLRAIAVAKQHGIDVLIDAVMNVGLFTT